ncbi:hypothetical protein SK128_008993 [Halocaridina rubra]|uniref:Uncharacterized protein n=1 Tax=Halocaridina rubra TaxID=373956 RepID=A0AAN9AB48_HALRR
MRYLIPLPSMPIHSTPPFPPVLNRTLTHTTRHPTPSSFRPIRNFCHIFRHLRRGCKVTPMSFTKIMRWDDKTFMTGGDKGQYGMLHNLLTRDGWQKDSKGFQVIGWARPIYARGEELMDDDE